MTQIPGPAEQEAVRVDYRLVVQHMEQRYMAQVSALINENAQLAAMQDTILAERDEAVAELETMRQLQGQKSRAGYAPRPIKDNPQA